MKQKKYLPNIIVSKLTVFEVTFFFILFGIMSYGIYSFFCITYQKLNFDSQIPLAWNFFSSYAFIPYKDIFFPYGILFYFTHQNFLLDVIYVLILPLLFVSFLLFLKKLWSNRLYAYTSFIFLAYFIIKFPGIETFRRYGIIAVFGLFISSFFYKKVYINNLTSLLVGLLVGIVFSLVNDQGIYAFSLFGLFLLINPLIRSGVGVLKKRKYYVYLFLGLASFAMGTFFGFLPFFIYLFYHKIYAGFFQYVVHLADFPLYSKTPFIPFSATPDNIFTFSMLFLSIFFIAYKLFYRKQFSLSFYVIASYVLIIILLEQKSLIRSLDKVITFFPVMLFIVLVHEFVIFFKKYEISSTKILLCYIILIFVVLFKLNLHPFIVSTYVPMRTINFSPNLTKKNYENNSCFSMNLNSLLMQDKKFKEVESQIKKDPEFSGKIFSYLSDPIFYVLFKQKPPYYFTIFEASPLYAQKENVRYIKDNNVSHLIYNMNIVSLQDNVPDYARGSLLFRYIINNFTIEKNIENFLIFKKTYENNDFFENEILQELRFFQDYLLQVKLEAIPRSEGIYKEKDVYINNDNRVFSSNLSLEMNNFLGNNIVTSSQKIVIMKAKKYKNKNKYMRLTLKAADKKTTTIDFQKCDIEKPCIIYLANIPLFYKERILREIIPDSSFEGEITLVKVNGEQNNLW